MPIIKLDLHVHTRFSPDSKASFKAINHQCRAAGIDGYAVTDHETIKGLQAAREAAEGLVVLPGMEVSARRAHIIALDPSDTVQPGLSLAETVELIHEQGATAVLAHPYGLPRSWANPEAVRQAGFDAIEVANSAQFPFKLLTGKNLKLAQRLGLPCTGGSDSHVAETVGRCYTVIDTPSLAVEDIIESIRRGRAQPVGEGMTMKERLSQFYNRERVKEKLRRLLPR